MKRLQSFEPELQTDVAWETNGCPSVCAVPVDLLFLINDLVRSSNLCTKVNPNKYVPSPHLILWDTDMIWPGHLDLVLRCIIKIYSDCTKVVRLCQKIAFLYQPLPTHMSLVDLGGGRLPPLRGVLVFVILLKILVSARYCGVCAR